MTFKTLLLATSVTITFQFPGVIELNVGGTHNFTTLLSTLVKEEGSILAQMFTGQLPVYKDKNDRYFLDGDGSTFQVILDYLKYGTMPLCNPVNNFSFGGGFGAGFQRTFNSADSSLIFKNATKFGLKRLAEHVEQSSNNVYHNKLEEFRSSLPGYDDCLSQIIDAIPPEDLLLKSHLAMRIRKHEFNSSIDARCCEHTCQQSYNPTHQWGVSGHSIAVDVTVDVSFEVDSAFLALLCYDLLQRGFNVHGRETHCDFSCNKEQPYGGFVTRGQTFCCRQKLHILNFALQANSPFYNSQPFAHKGSSLFGSKTNAPTNTFTFGTAQPQQQSAFGGGAAFGSSNPGSGFESSNIGSAFGSSNTGNAFGSSNTGCTFGSSSSVGGFGSSNTGFSFGSANSGGLFGTKTQPEAAGVFGFGTTNQQQTTVGFGSSGPGLFGAAAPAKSPFGQPTFGTPQKNSFGSQQSYSFGSQQGAQKKLENNAGIFGNKQQAGHVFGAPPTFSNSPSPKPIAKASGGVFGSLTISDEQTAKTDKKVKSEAAPRSFTFGVPSTKA